MNTQRREQHAPLVSIVIPCFNQGTFLGEAIHSALEQTYDNTEIVVIDDGSTEDVLSIVKPFGRVQYIRQNNQGLSAARNRGLHHSQAEYVVFLDADDRLLPCALKAGLQCFRKHPGAVFVSGGHYRINMAGHQLDSPYIADIHHEHYEAFLRGNYVVMHATVMYRRKLLLQAGGFDVRLDACEDYDVYLRLSYQFRTACHKSVVAEYRVHPTSMSRDLARMLRNVKTVHRRQRPLLHGHSSRYQAYAAGARYWNSCFVNPLVGEALRAMRNGRLRKAIGVSLVLAKHAPICTSQVILHRVLKRVLPAWVQRHVSR